MPGPKRRDGKRHPGGKLVQEVDPTPEVLRNRALHVGDDKARDPRAGYPIGILALRGAINHGDYVAAMRYGALYASVWGRGSIRSHLAEVVSGLRGSRWSDAGEREAIQIRLAGQLGEATAALHALPTRRPYSVLVNLAVYEHPMRFMDTARARTAEAWAADQRDLEALTEATGTLAKLWEIGRGE